MILTSILTSRVAGTRREGTIAVTHHGLTYGYRYRRGTGRARHDLTVWQSGGGLAASPMLADMLADLAVRSAEAGTGEHAWHVEHDGLGWAIRSATDAEVAA